MQQGRSLSQSIWAVVHTMGRCATMVLAAMEVHHAGCCEASEAALGAALCIWSNGGAGHVRLQALGRWKTCAGEVSRLTCCAMRAFLTMKLPVGSEIGIPQT